MSESLLRRFRITICLLLIGLLIVALETLT